MSYKLHKKFNTVIFQYMEVYPQKMSGTHHIISYNAMYRMFSQGLPPTTKKDITVIPSITSIVKRVSFSGIKQYSNHWFLILLQYSMVTTW